MTPEAELLLFAASRAQLVREVIRPAIDAGKVVLCDRFLDSTTVYQGVGRRIASEPVSMINRFAVGDLMPDLTVVIDLPAELGIERTRFRAREMPDRMEQENIEFYRKVREGYLMLAKALPGRFIIADGSKPIDEVEKQIWEQLRTRVV
jgi:dTMP kinase